MQASKSVLSIALNLSKVQMRSNKNLEVQKKLKQFNETKILQVLQLRQSYEQKMEAVAARKTLSLESKRYDCLEENLLPFCRSKAKEELTKVREVIKRKESPVDGASGFSSPHLDTPTGKGIIIDKFSLTFIENKGEAEHQYEMLRVQSRKANRKKAKKIRQKILSIKKKLETSLPTGNASIEKFKYKNQKVKRLLQDLQTQVLNNRIEIGTLQELNKILGSKVSL